MAAKSLLFVAPPLCVTGVFQKIKDDGFEASIADSLKGALSFIKKSRPQAVFSRVRMSGYAVEDLLSEAGAEVDFPPVIVFTDEGSASEAQRLMNLGAKDYWLEPLVWEKIVAALPAERSPSVEPAQVQAAPSAPTGQPGFKLVGRHPSIQRTLALVKQVARSKATVLIAGESGVGKEMIAKRLHADSDRANRPFIAVNCAALPEHLLESELFGHEKGAFTGAISRKPGKFELADGGTLLLDEISEMDLGLQAKLLRVLQEGEIDRVGGVETVKVDVRILATTNRNLKEWAEQGKFRQDLYFRLNVIPLVLPPLRERGEDVLLLARFFVDKFRAQYKIPPLDFARDAADWLMAYDWPGNVRELQNLMERAVLLAGTGPIRKSHFLLDDAASWTPEEDFGPDAALAAEPGAEPMAEPGDDSAGFEAPRPVDVEGPAPDPLSPESLENMMAGRVLPLSEMERIMIMRGLAETSGNRTQAAELLGISVRTLRNKLNEYRMAGLDVPQP